MGSTSEIESGSDMAPVTFNGVCRIKALMVETLFIPILVFILELCIFLLIFLFIRLVIEIFPPVEVTMNLINELMRNLHSNFKFLLVVNAIFKGDIDHAHHLG